MTMSEAGEAREVAVCRDEFAAVLESQGRVIGVGHQLAASASGETTSTCR
jgi:hypothetical protein